jgi:hypothetical protein
MNNVAAIGFWNTVWLLLKASRRRSKGRLLRQQQLLNNRSGRRATNWGPLGVIIGVVVMAFLHGAAALAVFSAVEAGQKVELDRQGKVVVSDWFVAWVEAQEARATEPAPGEAGGAIDASFGREAKEIVKNDGGDQASVERRLRVAVAVAGSRSLVSRHDAEPGLSALGRTGRVGMMLGSIMLLWWFAMVVCQGEGLELDL